MENKEALKTMLQHIIFDRTEDANAALHDYFVNKTREVSGLAQQEEIEEETDSEEDSLSEGKIDVEAILRKLEQSTQGNPKVVRAHWLGGSAAGLETYVSKLEKNGFDSAGAWIENKEYFKKIGLSKTEYNALVKASL